MDKKKGRTPAPVKSYCTRHATRTRPAIQSGAFRCCPASCLWCRAHDLAVRIPYLPRTRKQGVIRELLATLIKALAVAEDIERLAG